MHANRQRNYEHCWYTTDEQRKIRAEPIEHLDEKVPVEEKV